MSYVVDGAVTPEFAALMVALAEAYPSARLRESTVRMYAQQLADLSLDQVKAAMAAAIRDSEFFPTVAFIRKQVLGSADDAALVAWSAFANAAISAGAYSSVEIEDGCAAEALVVVFGSWAEFCETPDGPQLALKRQEFLAAYRTARRSPQAPRRLPGLCEATGRYPSGLLAPHVWTATITATGSVLARREQKRIGSVEPKALGEGDSR